MQSLSAWNRILIKGTRLRWLMADGCQRGRNVSQGESTAAGIGSTSASTDPYRTISELYALCSHAIAMSMQPHPHEGYTAKGGKLRYTALALQREHTLYRSVRYWCDPGRSGPTLSRSQLDWYATASPWPSLLACPLIRSIQPPPS